MNTGDLPPLMLIAGPTASGKSAYALRQAEAHGGVVVNADSMQVYRDLRVLTARPSVEDEACAPHRLFGHVDGGYAYSAACWAEAARTALEEARAAGMLPILVGGTGLYIRTLLDGIAPVPPIDGVVRRAVRALPVDVAHEALQREDPVAAARLHANDTARVARALEVIRSTGRSLLDWQRARVGGIADSVDLDPVVLDPDPLELAINCDRRVDAMIAGGALEEVDRLRERRLDPALPVMRSLGVPALIAHLEGRRSLPNAVEELKRETRAYVKRQRTWNRGQLPLSWPRVSNLSDLVPRQRFNT